MSLTHYMFLGGESDHHSYRHGGESGVGASSPNMVRACYVVKNADASDEERIWKRGMTRRSSRETLCRAPPACPSLNSARDRAAIVDADTGEIRGERNMFVKEVRAVQNADVSNKELERNRRRCLV